ncbi:uncharacterized protein LOC62_01G001043 [Vanrija pseudolonga]|uniref:Transmembrane protein n=1 Tax=Vanrija pseudolonga TaxID=143232 RepID=A0AAF0Y3G2_9TREE|nr:hypothetical protein LOC62_01G001043 [Vanrija pseudolonga]
MSDSLPTTVFVTVTTTAVATVTTTVFATNTTGPAEPAGVVDKVLGTMANILNTVFLFTFYLVWFGLLGFFIIMALAQCWECLGDGCLSALCAPVAVPFKWMWAQLSAVAGSVGDLAPWCWEQTRTAALGTMGVFAGWIPRAPRAEEDEERAVLFEDKDEEEGQGKESHEEPEGAGASSS